MVLSQAFWSYGSLLQMGDGATPENFSTIAEVMDINAPSMSRDEIEVTSQDSVNGWREFIAGFRDGGELSFDVNWIPTDSTQDHVTGLVSQFLFSDGYHTFKLILPDTILTISFSAWVSAWDGSLPLEDRGQSSVTLRITGAVTFA